MARRQATGFSFSVSRARERALFSPSFWSRLARSLARSLLRSLAPSHERPARLLSVSLSLSLAFWLPPSQTPVPMLLLTPPRVPEDTARSSANFASRMQRALLASIFGCFVRRAKLSRGLPRINAIEARCHPTLAFSRGRDKYLPSRVITLIRYIALARTCVSVHRAPIEIVKPSHRADLSRRPEGSRC